VVEVGTHPAVSEVLHSFLRRESTQKTRDQEEIHRVHARAAERISVMLDRGYAEFQEQLPQAKFADHMTGEVPEHHLYISFVERVQPGSSRRSLEVSGMLLHGACSYHIPFCPFPQIRAILA
jgi:hypothetical protein